MGPPGNPLRPPDKSNTISAERQVNLTPCFAVAKHGVLGHSGSAAGFLPDLVTIIPARNFLTSYL